MWIYKSKINSDYFPNCSNSNLHQYFFIELSQLTLNAYTHPAPMAEHSGLCFIFSPVRLELLELYRELNERNISLSQHVEMLTRMKGKITFFL